MLISVPSYIIYQFGDQVMQYDPHFESKMNELQANFLNFVPAEGDTKTLFFSGNAYSLKKKTSQISPNTEYESIRVNLTGTLYKPENMCCFWWTIIVGSLLIFPLFFICCDWWKKVVNKGYKIENQGYDALLELIDKNKAEEVYLQIQDNFFNRNKAEVLIEGLQKIGRVNNFVFRNVASAFDSEGSNYSDFDEYMRPLKKVIKRTEIIWGGKVVV